MCKKEHKSFKEYAQRWRDLAAQVAPPMMEIDVAPYVACRPWIFFINRVIGFLKFNGSGMKNEER